MAKVLLRQIKPHTALYRCDRTGIAWVEDGTTGGSYSAHPNISVTGSVRGMRERGYWRKTDRVVRTHSYQYNIDSVVTGDQYREEARRACRCGGACGKRRG